MPLLPENYRFTEKGVRSVISPPPKKGMYPPVGGHDGDLASDPYGLPPDWNWRTAKLGPDNQPLPNGAESWDPFGRPYYGAGLSGVWNRFVSKLRTEIPDMGTETRIVNGREVEVDLDTPLNRFMRGALQFNNAGLNAALGLAAEPAEATERGLGTGFGLQQAAEGRGTAIDPFREITGLNELEAQAEQFQAVAREGGRQAAEEQFRAGVEAGAIDRTLGVRVAAQRLRNIFNGLILNSAPVLFYNAAKAFSGPRSLAEVQDIVRAEQRASTMLYTSWIDPAARNELMRAIEAGALEQWQRQRETAN